MFCTECGKENRETSKYCFACGATLSADIAEPATPEAKPVHETGEESVVSTLIKYLVDMHQEMFSPEGDLFTEMACPSQKDRDETYRILVSCFLYSLQRALGAGSLLIPWELRFDMYDSVASSIVDDFLAPNSGKDERTRLVGELNNQAELYNEIFKTNSDGEPGPHYYVSKEVLRLMGIGPNPVAIAVLTQTEHMTTMATVNFLKEAQEKFPLELTDHSESVTKASPLSTPDYDNSKSVANAAVRTTASGDSEEKSGVISWIIIGVIILFIYLLFS